MKNFWGVLAAALLMGTAAVRAEDMEGEGAMRIKLAFDDKTVIVKMEDNSASRQLVNMLPAKFEFIDFAGQEKISEFPGPVSLSNAPRGMIARAGKMFIYVPWGNLGFFYKDHGHTPDSNLIELGEVEKGLEALTEQKGGFSAEMTVLNGDERP